MQNLPNVALGGGGTPHYEQYLWQVAPNFDVAM